MAFGSPEPWLSRPSRSRTVSEQAPGLDVPPASRAGRVSVRPTRGPRTHGI